MITVKMHNHVSFVKTFGIFNLRPCPYQVLHSLKELDKSDELLVNSEPEYQDLYTSALDH